MDYSIYLKANELERKMKLLEDLSEGRIKVDDKSSFFPIYSFLIYRDDFKEYIKKVYNELNEEFKAL